MATIDIGKIKPVFKGTYDNSTAYVLDDIVYYNGSSYVAKTSTTGNLPTDTTKWNILASGSGGIWNSSLSLGSAGQVVKVNSGASALEFGTLSSDFVKIASGSTTASNYIDIQGCFSTSYKLYKLFCNFTFDAGNYLEVGLLKASDNSLDTATYYIRANGEYGNSGSANARWTNAGNQNDYRQDDSQGFRVVNTWQNEKADEHSMMEMTFDNPIDTRKTLIQHQTSWSQSNYVGMSHGYGMLNSTLSHSGIRLGASGSANFTTTGYYAVYGLKN